MGDDWQGWIQVLIFVLIILGPMLRGIFRLVAPKQPPPRRAPGQPPPRGRGIHEVLEEIRREVEGNEVQPAPQNRPQAPPTRREVEPRDVPLHRADPAQRQRQMEARRAPQRAPARETPRPPAARKRLVPAETPRRRQPSAEPAVSPEFRNLGDLKSSLDETQRNTNFSTGVRQAATTPPAEERRAPPTLLGMDLRQVILAQVILGPPRVLEQGRPPGLMSQLPAAAAIGGIPRPASPEDKPEGHAMSQPPE